MASQVSAALKQARICADRRKRLTAATDRSSKVAREHQKSRRDLEDAIVAAGSIDVPIGLLLPLEQDVCIVDEQAVDFVRHLLTELLGDQKYRRVVVRYTRDNSDPCKRLGMPYPVTGKQHNANEVDGKRDPQAMVEQNHRNGTMQVWCARRKRWTSIKLGAVSEVEVRGEMYPVRFINPATEEPVALAWKDAPVRPTVSGKAA